MSLLFEKTIECANILNGLSFDNADYELPSTNQRLVWSEQLYKQLCNHLDEIKKLIKYDEVNGTSHEPYEHLMNIKGVSYEEAEMSSIPELTDTIYASLYHSSDRWSLTLMALVSAKVEVLGKKLKYIK